MFLTALSFIVLRALGFPLVLLCWDLNWRGYRFATALRFILGYALLCWVMTSFAYFLTMPDFWRILGASLLAWVTGGWTRRIFGEGVRFSWRLPSLND